jgi:serine/threonine protein kinase
MPRFRKHYEKAAGLNIETCATLAVIIPPTAPFDSRVCAVRAAARDLSGAEMPEQISSYRLESELARGGMGIVYRGVHTVFEEVVAIKAIFPELTLNPELRARFVNEAKIQRRLQHPNIVQIREFLIEQGRFYIVMELIEGETLAERLKRLAAPLPSKEALEIFPQALQGLGFAHAQGVIHRDMKPSNVMLTREGVAKLTDFGIARAVGVPGLTRTGMVLGTPAYMAPEQVQGHQVDKRTDIYSLGVTLYEMVAGRVPFEKPKDSDSDYQVLRAHIEEPPQPPSRLVATIPPFVEAAILKAMAKRPEERFASCEEFEAALVPAELPATRRIIPAAQPSVALRPATPERAAVPQAVAPRVLPAEMKTHAGYWAALVLAIALGVGGYWLNRVRPSSSPTVTSPPIRELPATKPSTPAPAIEQPTEPAGARSALPRDEPTQKAPVRTREAPAGKTVAKPAKAVRESPAAVPSRVEPGKPSGAELAVQVQALISQANTALDRGEYDAAISIYRRALELDPANQEARAGIDRAQRAKAAEEATK